MIRITDEQIEALGISPVQCVEWVKESFCMKYDAQLPTKISLHPQGTDFFNTMPCLMPAMYDRFCCKIVSRIEGMHPALRSDLWLYRASSGEMLAWMDANWITQMRTGAVAALAIQTLKSAQASTYAFVGLGSTAQATMACLLATMPQNESFEVKLFRYKNHAEQFMKQFGDKRINYILVDTYEELIKDSDVIVSAVTEMSELFCPNDTLFKPGVLVVPIHTKGFQNCDLCFDHIFADDKGHVEGFRYFKQFRQFNELSEVLLGKIPARKTDEERILAYNIGLGLHDAVFANHIYERFSC